jgi:hypothetical protein
MRKAVAVVPKPVAEKKPAAKVDPAEVKRLAKNAAERARRAAKKRGK